MDQAETSEESEPEAASDFDAPKRWPIHQRLIGAAVKGTFATVAALPLAVFVLVKEYRRWEWERLWAVAIGGLCATVVFVFERRGSKWWATALRLCAAGACIAVITPLAAVWLGNLGDPVAAYKVIGRWMRLDRLLGYAIFTALLALFFALAGVWIHVRNRTASLVPQICAGVLTLAVPVVMLLSYRPGRNAGWASFLLVTAVLVPLGTWFADRFAKRWDPDAPAPTGGDLRVLWAVSGVLTWFVFSLPYGTVFLRTRGGYGPSNDSQALRAMRSLTTAQLLYREGDKDANGVLDFAGSLTDLDLAGLLDLSEIRGGYYAGYVFRVIRSREAPGEFWAAAADPVDPNLRRHFVTNHEGKVYYTYNPVHLNPTTCELPDSASEAY